MVVVKFELTILKTSVNVATSLAILTPSEALNVNVPDVAVPAESSLSGVMVKTDESLLTVAMLSKPTSVVALNVIGNPSESVALIVMTVVVEPSVARTNGEESPAAVCTEFIEGVLLTVAILYQPPVPLIYSR